MTGGRAPTECEVVDVGWQISAEPGVVIRAASKVVWVEHNSGRSQIAGLPELSVGARRLARAS